MNRKRWLAAATALPLCLTGCYGGGEGLAETPWDRAATLTGKDAIVCGPLVSINSTEDETFLNIGRDYPDHQRVTVVIWETYPDLDISTGATLCAQGEVDTYEGSPQIQYQSRAEFEDGVEIIGGVTDEPTTPSPSRTMESETPTPESSTPTTSGPTTSGGPNEVSCLTSAEPLMQNLIHLQDEDQLTLAEYSELVTWLTYSAQDSSQLIDENCHPDVASLLYGLTDDHLHLLNHWRGCFPKCSQITLPDHHGHLTTVQAAIRMSDS